LRFCLHSHALGPAPPSARVSRLMMALNRLNGWCRAALVFSVLWFTCVAGLRAYERYATIGSTNGPWAFYRDYGRLVFYHVEVDRKAERVSFWLLSQRFWTVLVLPVCLSWLVAALAPACRWVRRGFQA